MMMKNSNQLRNSYNSVGPGLQHDQSVVMENGRNSQASQKVMNTVMPMGVNHMGQNNGFGHQGSLPGGSSKPIILNS
jgi:hypothetical protein